MGRTTAKKNKGFAVHQWQYKGRNQVMDCLKLNDGSIPYAMLKSGLRINITDNEREHSKIQKNLRQFLYKKLVELGLPTDSYILIFKAPTHHFTKETERYIQIDVMIPNIHGNEIEKNVDLFNLVIDKFISEVK